jgi:DNA-binding CsgD family transcriptional regulator
MEGAMWLVPTSAVAGNLPFCLENGEFIVGRTSRAHIVIAEATVSRRHALLVHRRGHATLKDLGSSNGTFHNERPVTRCEFSVGDQIRFGSVTCAVSTSPLAGPPRAEQESTFHVRKTLVPPVPTEQLTAAQQEIANHLLQGRTETEIALLLHKSPHTIHTHLKAIFQRLGVHSRAELIVKLLRNP